MDTERRRRTPMSTIRKHEIETHCKSCTSHDDNDYQLSRAVTTRHTQPWLYVHGHPQPRPPRSTAEPVIAFDNTVCSDFFYVQHRAKFCRHFCVFRRPKTVRVRIISPREPSMFKIPAIGALLSASRMSAKLLTANSGLHVTAAVRLKESEYDTVISVVVCVFDV